MIVNELIRLSCERLSTGARFVATATERVKNAGLRKLLLSLSQQENENAVRVAEWGEALTPAESDREIDGETKSPAPPDAAVLPNGDGRILSAIIQYKKSLEGLFAQAASVFSDGEGGVLFRGLANDEKKQAALLQDRRDLLNLM